MEKLRKYLLLLFLLFVAALNFNMILKPFNLTTGGNQGLAILLSHVFNLRPSFIILIINIIMLILSYFLLSKETTFGTVVATFVYPLLVRLTSFINFNINNYEIIFVIISGIICGVTCGYIYRLGFSQGGINILSVILKKYFKIKIYKTNFIINFIILCFGIYYFGFVKGFYSFIVIIINSYLINKILSKKTSLNSKK